MFFIFKNTETTASQIHPKIAIYNPSFLAYPHHHL